MKERQLQIYYRDSLQNLSTLTIGPPHEDTNWAWLLLGADRVVNWCRENGLDPRDVSWKWLDWGSDE